MMEEIINYLKKRKKTKISLNELSKQFPGNTSYEEFAQTIKELEDQKLLIPVKKHGLNNKNISLFNTYRINSSYFKQKLTDKIQTLKLKFHESINLNSYYSSNIEELDKDLKYIYKIDKYLKKNGFPQNECTPPERSYNLIGDEKWIDEGGGEALLQKINLWDKFKITRKNDPLMVAVNPKEMSKEKHKHMIVENKSTFYIFLDVLSKTNFTSLVYGSGWKIVSNINMLQKQLGLQEAKHILYYFGDIDYEGISIWYGLNRKTEVKLAIEFYKKLMKRRPSIGKEGQQKNSQALNIFLKYFNIDEKNSIINLLETGRYYPQEGLNEVEVEKIWRHGQWMK